MNGCDSHMEASAPGCVDCFHHLMGRYDATKSEMARWKAMHEAASEKERLGSTGRARTGATRICWSTWLRS